MTNFLYACMIVGYTHYLHVVTATNCYIAGFQYSRGIGIGICGPSLVLQEGNWKLKPETDNGKQKWLGHSIPNQKKKKKKNPVNFHDRYGPYYKTFSH